MIDPRIVEDYEKFSSDLIAYATAIVGAQEAPDVVSEAMLRIFTNIDWGRVKEPRGYLFRCVLNEALRRGKRNSRRPYLERMAGLVRSERIDSGPKLDELGVFEVLSKRERAVIYLSYWEDLPINEIASVLGISDGAVRRYLARARAKLREALVDERGRP